MAQFKAYSSAVEVNGETVYTIVDGMGAFKPTAIKILAGHGIVNPTAEMWYSQQGWLDAFQEIAKNIGNRTLFLIGTKIPENAQFPPEITTIEGALTAIDVAYHMNHRNGEIGSYRFEKTGKRSGKMVCRNPYPCDFDRGIIEAMMSKFKIPGDRIQVTHTEDLSCRKKGAESCTYSISW